MFTECFHFASVGANMETRHSAKLCVIVLLGLFFVSSVAPSGFKMEDKTDPYSKCRNLRVWSRHDCRSNSHCTEKREYSWCNPEKCICECVRQTRWGDRVREVDGNCIKWGRMRKNGESCQFNDDCDAENRQECAGLMGTAHQICVCQFGFKWDQVLKLCKPYPPRPSCLRNWQCVGFLGMFGICDPESSVCKCHPGTRRWRQKGSDGRVTETCILLTNHDLNQSTQDRLAEVVMGKEPPGLPVWAILLILTVAVLLLAFPFYLLVLTLRKCVRDHRHRSRKPVDTVSPLLPLHHVRQTATRIAHVTRAEFVVLIHHVLGSGKGGIVCKGQFGATTVAVKALNPDCRRVDMYMDSMDREIEIYQLMPDHENVIKLLAYCDCEYRNRYLLLEFCELGSLGTFLVNNIFHEGPAPDYVNFPNSGQHIYRFRNLLDFACEIATGAESLAEQRIVHGDLACRNVLLDAHWVPKIADFGLAHKLGESPTYIQTTNGPKPWKWSAPEVLTQNKFSIHSDVWSFGVTLWEIFSLGAEPYQGLQYFDAFPRDLYQGFHRLAKPDLAPIQLYRLMKKCWESELENRIGFTELKLQLTDLYRGGNQPQIDSRQGEEGADGYLLHAPPTQDVSV